MESTQYACVQNFEELALHMGFTDTQHRAAVELLQTPARLNEFKYLHNVLRERLREGNLRSVVRRPSTLRGAFRQIARDISECRQDSASTGADRRKKRRPGWGD